MSATPTSRLRTASFPTTRTRTKQQQLQPRQRLARLTRPATDDGNGSSNNIEPTGRLKRDNTNSNNIHVYVRCRSRNQREIDEKSSVVISTLGPNGKEVILSSYSNSFSSSSSHSSSSSSTGTITNANTHTSNSSFLLSPKKTYTFDQVFGPEADQELVFEQTAKNYIAEMLRGYNCTVFAYGQTGTGKTYTMSGDLNILGDLESQDKILLGEHAGIIPRVLVDLFKELSKDKNCDYSVKVSFLELYNERLRDLLAGGEDNSNGSGNSEETIRIYDNHSSFHSVPSSSSSISSTTTSSLMRTTGGNHNNNHNSNSNNNSRAKVSTTTTTTTTTSSGHDGRHISSYSPIMVKGMEEIYIKSAHEGLKLLTEGSLKRKVASTKCNDLSSRSHTIFTITTNVTKTDPISGEEYVKIGKLNLVDLAGSENITRSGAENKRAQEAGLINKSLLTLGRVINALVDHSQHIPYRESKLTRLLQDSLGGKTKTCIIATISPARISSEETVSTLEYATRAKSIKNTPQINQLMPKNSHLSEYVQEIERLRRELRVSRTKEGIYVTQDQYELFESNELLIKEQKMRMHNMEEQLQRFKDQYVKQTEINKGLQLRLNDTELKLADLERQKKSLVDLFEDYESSHDKYVESVIETHAKNFNLIQNLNNERNLLVGDVTKFGSVTELVLECLREQSESISGVKQYWEVYRDKFREVTEGVLTELEDKITDFKQGTRTTLTSIELESFITQVQKFQESVNRQLQILDTISSNENFDKVADDHRHILQTCYNDISLKYQEFDTLLQNSLGSISDMWEKTIQGIQSTTEKQFSSTDRIIKSQREHIRKLESEIQQERKASQVASTKLHDLETWFNDYVSTERKQLFETLQSAFATFEEKHSAIYDNVFNMAKSTVLNVRDELEKHNEKCISKLSNEAIDAIGCIDHSLQHNRQNLDAQLVSKKPELASYVANLPLLSSLQELKRLLSDRCGEDASASLLSTIEGLKRSVIKDTGSVQLSVSNLVRELSETVRNDVTLKESQIKSISEEINNICAYIMEDYKENALQIPRTQSSIVTERNMELGGIITKMDEAKDKMEPLIAQRGHISYAIIDRGDLKIAELEPFVKPQSYEVINCLRSSGTNSPVAPKSEGSPDCHTSPSPESSENSIPSTPVPIPDKPLPLPQVLIPRSVNSSTRKVRSKANSLGLESDLGKPNNMKRRFTTDTNTSIESKENLEPVETKRLHLSDG